MILEPSCSVCDGVCAARALYTGAYCSFPITMYAWMYVWIHVCSFTFLTDIYSEHWTNQIPCLEWFKIYFYELCQCICWYTHSPPRPSFCFSDYLDLCTKAKQFSNSWGSIFPLPIRFHCRAIRLTLTLGGSAMTPRRSAVLCSCHEAGVTKVFFFLQEADCIWDYEYAMTLISTEAPEQGLTSPHPHFVFLQNWLMNCFIPSVMWSAVVVPQCNESCPFWEDHWLQKLIVRNYFDFVKLCLDGA